MNKLHYNPILWDSLNKRTFKSLFNEFNNLFNICKDLADKRNTSLYLRIYNLLIYALFDLIHYNGFEYICAEYGEDFSDNERFIFIPKYGIIFDHICGGYLTIKEWEQFCRDFIQKGDIFSINKKEDYSYIDMVVCIDAFF